MQQQQQQQQHIHTWLGNKNFLAAVVVRVNLFTTTIQPSDLFIALATSRSHLQI
jgi:hypothetical protein